MKRRTWRESLCSRQQPCLLPTITYVTRQPGLLFTINLIMGQHCLYIKIKSVTRQPGLLTTINSVTLNSVTRCPGLLNKISSIAQQQRLNLTINSVRRERGLLTTINSVTRCLGLLSKIIPIVQHCNSVRWEHGLLTTNIFTARQYWPPIAQGKELLRQRKTPSASLSELQRPSCSKF